MASFNLWGATTFKANVQTYVITHGFRNTGGHDQVPAEEWIRKMAAAIRSKDPTANIVITDWHEQADVPFWSYNNAAQATKQVGKEIASYLIQNGANPDKTTLIGHSLGAQASGFAGQEYKARTGKLIGNIFGLDKAGPQFEDKTNPNEYLDSTDAKFVATFRTSDTLGDNRPTGHLNLHFRGLTGAFWNNHGRSQQLFTQMLTGSLTLPGLDVNPFQWSGQPTTWGNKEVSARLLTPIRETATYAEQARDTFNDAENTISPLVLDLDNDGIELVSISSSQAFFDLDGDGFAEHTGWVKSDDGILALDRNGNGSIDNITEVFGNETTDGFIILKQLDSNHDNLIDSRDSQFANLLIWQDNGQDGWTESGELKSLTSLGIRSINLSYQAVNQINAGNRISSVSSYTHNNGTSRQIVDVWFALDQMRTVYAKNVPIKEEAYY